MSIQIALNIAKMGLQTQETILSVATENISGQSVDAYKQKFAIAYETVATNSENATPGTATSQNGTANPTGVQIGSGAQIAAVYRSFAAGESIQTGRSLDTMIDGEGFYQVSLPDGTYAYTRIGSFERDANNALVMPKTGFALSPSIVLPTDATRISINNQGQVYVETSPGQETLVGQLQLAVFFNPSGLQAIGDSMFVQTQASGVADIGNPSTGRRGRIKQAYREGSNVNAVEEMTSLIKIEKVYEMLTKAVKTGDAMMAASNRMVST